MKPRIPHINIWALALGYFLFYIPNTALTRVVIGDLLGKGVKLPGPTLLPMLTLTSSLGMLSFLALTGLWKYAHQTRVGGLSIPTPRKGTFFSGLATAMIIITTMYSYTFEGVSIVFVMLLMRGGVLILAPVVDSLRGRESHWYSWAGLGLSFLALIVAFLEKGASALPLLLVIDIALYVASYFVRLNLMTVYAKSDSVDDRYQYFAEEAMTSAIVSFLVLVLLAFFGWGTFPTQLKAGFSFSTLGPYLPWILLNGLASLGVGVFGSMILLDQSENTYTIPVNRSSSILAGVVASGILFVLFEKTLSAYKLAGAFIIIAAILVLSLPKLFKSGPAPETGSSE
jgi:drug/metabolite transporter (DMT)-like permease